MPFRRANTLTAVRTARMMLHARKRRKIPRQRHPDNVALGYFGALVEILRHAREAVERHVLPELDALVRASDSLRHDAKKKNLEGTLVDREWRESIRGGKFFSVVSAEGNTVAQSETRARAVEIAESKGYTVTKERFKSPTDRYLVVELPLDRSRLGETVVIPTPGEFIAAQKAAIEAQKAAGSVRGAANSEWQLNNYLKEIGAQNTPVATTAPTPEQLRALNRLKEGMSAKGRALSEQLQTNKLISSAVKAAAPVAAESPTRNLQTAMAKAAEAFDRNYQNQERAYASLARGTAERVSAFNRGELGKQIQAAIGVDLPINDPKLDLRIQEFTAENVAKISDLAPQYLKDVENTINKGMRSGARPEDIRTALEDRFGVAESRAKFIARDQVGKFNGALNQARQKAVGVEGYTWRTMNDNRVRDEHVPREGKSYKWSDPPEGGHPGEDYQCRCYPEPDFSQILADLA